MTPGKLISLNTVFALILANTSLADPAQEQTVLAVDDQGTLITLVGENTLVTQTIYLNGSKLEEDSIGFQDPKLIEFVWPESTIDGDIVRVVGFNRHAKEIAFYSQGTGAWVIPLDALEPGKVPITLPPEDPTFHGAWWKGPVDQQAASNWQRVLSMSYPNLALLIDSAKGHQELVIAHHRIDRERANDVFPGESWRGYPDKVEDRELLARIQLPEGHRAVGFFHIRSAREPVLITVDDTNPELHLHHPSQEPDRGEPYDLDQSLKLPHSDPVTTRATEPLEVPLVFSSGRLLTQVGRVGVVRTVFYNPSENTVSFRDQSEIFLRELSEGETTIGINLNEAGVVSQVFLSVTSSGRPKTDSTLAAFGPSDALPIFDSKLHGEPPRNLFLKPSQTAIAFEPTMKSVLYYERIPGSDRAVIGEIRGRIQRPTGGRSFFGFSSDGSDHIASVALSEDEHILGLTEIRERLFMALILNQATGSMRVVANPKEETTSELPELSRSNPVDFPDLETTGLLSGELVRIIDSLPAALRCRNTLAGVTP